MADLTLRLTKGSPITFEEMDSNLLALDSDSPWHVSKSFITYPNPVGIGPGAQSPTYNIDFGEGDSFSVATIGTSDAALQIHVDGPHPFEIFTNTQERFTVTTAGLVGINVPNPAQPLDVDGIIQTTTTFIGNQAYCNSFYDGNMTISAGSIFNAENGNFSGRIRFGELRDDSGVVISRFATEVTPTDEKLPTSNAVVNYVTNAIDSSTSELNALLDSEHAWNVAEHQSLYDADSNLGIRIDVEIDNRSDADSDLGVRIDNITSDFDSAIDSEHAWNVAEHSALDSRIDSEHAWNVAEHSALDSRIDSEHAWNIAEHQLLSDSLTSEIIARKDADSDLGVRIDNITSDFDSALDSEHAWNVVEHQLLSDSLTAEIIARQNADSDLGIRIDDETQERKDADSDLGVRIDDLDSALDSEHAWNVAEHNALKDADSDINARIDSEHAWNVVEHNELDLSILAEILARSNADSDINDRIDSEHAWNVTEHLELSNANSDLSVAIDSNFKYFTDITNQLEININNLDSRLDSELVVIDGKLDSLSGSISNEINVEIENIQNNIDSIEDRLDSEHAWNIAEHNILQSQFDNLTTDSVTEGSNLYYTNARVDARNDSTIDSNFLNDRMPLGNLSDVQINLPTLENDDVLQWNGTVWSNQSIGIVGTIQFRGGVDATTENAPIVKENGDFYVNVTSGTALGTWTGLTQVDSGDALVWDSDGDTWGNLGKITQGSVVKVRPGTAISVDETDPARPTVSVDKTITDTWYYTQSQIDSTIDSEHAWNVAEHSALTSRIDSEHAWNVAEHAALDSDLSAAIDSLALSISGDINVELGDIQVNIDSIEDRLDSEHAWNVAEHLSLTNKIDSVIDSEHAWNVAEHLELSNANSDLSSAIDSNFEYFTNITNQLEININNLDSRLDSELAVIDDRFDSLALSISGDISVEIGDIQANIDSIEDRLDSEHAWNVQQHLLLENANSDLSIAVDSNFNYFNNITNQLEININNLDSRLDSELAIIDDKLDSISLSIGGEINVEINQIQDQLDNLTTDSVAEGTTNLYYTDARVEALVDSAYVQERVTFPEFDSNSVIELVDSEFVNSLVDFPDTQVLNNTDSLPEGSVNLYYTDARVTALVDSAYVQSRVEFPEFDSNSVIELVDSEFVNSLVDFPDTQVLNTTDSLPEGIENLYYTDSRVENKILSTVDSEYVMERVTIESNLRFKGATSVDVYNAPIGPENGDIYINDSEAVANNTWIGIAGETIAEAQSLGWAEDEGRWYALGGLHDREIHDSDFVQARQQYVTLDSNVPTNPYSGELWFDRNEDNVKIYDGSVWFELPSSGAGGTIDSAELLQIIDSDYIQNRQQYVTLDSSAPANPYSGELWLDRNEDIIKIYDGLVWFEFPAGGGDGGSTLVIDSDAPTEVVEGDLWLDRNEDIVKIYDGSVWFEFPAGDGGLTEAQVLAIVDSALTNGIISLDASPSGGASDDF